MQNIYQKCSANTMSCDTYAAAPGPILYASVRMLSNECRARFHGGNCMHPCCFVDLCYFFLVPLNNSARYISLYIYDFVMYYTYGVFGSSLTYRVYRLYDNDTHSSLSPPLLLVHMC